MFRLIVAALMAAALGMGGNAFAQDVKETAKVVKTVKKDGKKKSANDAKAAKKAAKTAKKADKKAKQPKPKVDGTTSSSAQVN